jgi:FkbM family methyltransferase
MDGGAHMGLATFYFKSLYPEAKITSFEADPKVFSVLNANVIFNQLEGITLVKAALAGQTQAKIPFYGQISQDNPDARGNSIIKAWGVQRTFYDEIEVPSVVLSSYIPEKEEVDFLKLNIEGAEREVLEELEQQKKLPKVKAMTVKVHDAKETGNLEIIREILEAHHFQYTITAGNTSGLPEAVKTWKEKMKPAFFTLKAVRKPHAEAENAAQCSMKP